MADATAQYAAAPGAEGFPSAETAAPPARGRSLGPLPMALVAFGASALLGVGTGVVWDRLSPHLKGTLIRVDPQTIVGSTESTGAYFGPEAWFACLTIVSGTLAALALFAVLGTRGAGRVSALAGLAIGGAAGAWIAWMVGRALGPGEFPAAQIGQTVRAGVDLKATGVLLCWPIAASVVHFALTAGFGVDEPGPDPSGSADGLSETRTDSAAPGRGDEATTDSDGRPAASSG